MVPSTKQILRAMKWFVTFTTLKQVINVLSTRNF